MALRSGALLFLVTVLAHGQEAATAPRILNHLSLRSYVVRVEADEEAARVSVEEVFLNNGGGFREADFLFPMPAGAAPTNLELKMGDRFYGGNLLTRKRARRIYREITRRTRDPAILDCVGKDLYHCRVFPVPANATAAVRLGYRQPLAAEGSMRRLVIPLDATRFNRAPAGRFSLDVRIKTGSALQAVLCPTHEVSIERRSAHQAHLTLEARGAHLAGDIEILYAVDDAPLGAVVSSYKRFGQRGYFVLSVDAAFAREQQANAPRDIVVAIDTSNSTGRNAVDAAAAAVGDALKSLRPEDRFALLSFDTEPRLLLGFEHPVETTPTELRTLLAKHPVAGRTRFLPAIRRAAAVAAEGRPGTGIVLLTDGIASQAGEDPIKLVGEVARGGSRVGVCGVGTQVDRVRLDAMGRRGDGDSAYAVRGRGLARSVEHLFETTRAVPLTDISVSIKDVYELYPRRLAMVKAGGTILVAGRYHTGGPTTVTISAKVAGEPVTHTIRVDLRAAGGSPAVVRLWAARRIGHLLDEARAKGDPDLHKMEISRLGRRHAIVTPHTSLLVLEEADRKRFLAGMRPGPLMRTVGSGILARRPAVTREAAPEAELAERVKRLRRCTSGAAGPFRDLLGKNRMRIRQVGDRTFYRDQAGVWVESDLVDEAPGKPHVVRFLSKEWQELAADDDVARILALGRALLFRLETGQVVRVAS